MAIAENIKGMVDQFYRSAPVEMATKRATVTVGFGHRARQGKDTVVAHLVAKYAESKLIVRRYSFADALKVEVHDWLEGAGFGLTAIDCFLSETTWEEWAHKGTRKCVSLNRLGGAFFLPPYDNERRCRTIAEKVAWVDAHKAQLREMLQKWGTELRRSQDENYWVKKLQEQIAIDNPHAALISDMRFADEAAICDETVRVERTGYVESDPSIGKHISETGMDSYPYDYVLEAEDGQLPVLLAKAEETLDTILFDRRILVR